MPEESAKAIYLRRKKAGEEKRKRRISRRHENFYTDIENLEEKK